MRTEASRVDDPLGDALVIEVKDLLAKMEILEQCGAACADSQGVLIVRDGSALLRREYLNAFAGGLMGFSALRGWVRLCHCVVTPAVEGRWEEDTFPEVASLSREGARRRV
jgi:hypothetical protein